MIQLQSGCLVFRTANGQNIPCSAELVSIELIGNAADLVDAEVVRHASAAVLHYFRHNLGRTEVTVAEFTEALARALKQLGFEIQTPAVPCPAPAARVTESDLRQLACESGKGFELAFFARLRAEVCERLDGVPQVVHFTGLRGCVKQLVGARRWSELRSAASSHSD